MAKKRSVKQKGSGRNGSGRIGTGPCLLKRLVMDAEMATEMKITSILFGVLSRKGGRAV